MDLVWMDNRKGILPGVLAKRLTGARHVVQDCRELYDMRSAAGIYGKIGCVVERLFTKRSDVVIAANAWRAKLMVKMFGLAKTPLNYENVRRLEYSCEEERRQVEEACRGFFAEKKFRIVSTAGCDMTRMTGNVLEAMKELGDEYELLLIGESDEEDEQLAREIIRSLKLANVKIFPRMDQNHLKYFIANSQAGIVIYHQRDRNNKYCASGKIYEFLFEGKPVVTSVNPPLKEFCRKHKVGCASTDYARAIRRIAGQYGQWEDSVRKFLSETQVEKNNHRLAEQILEELRDRRAGL